MNILEIEHLHAAFPGNTVLHDINLAIQTGRKTAIVGESGSGKTVLAQGVMRLNPDVSLQGSMRFRVKTCWPCRKNHCANCAAATSAWCFKSR